MVKNSIKNTILSEKTEADVVELHSRNYNRNESLSN